MYICIYVLGIVYGKFLVHGTIHCSAGFHLDAKLEMCFEMKGKTPTSRLARGNELPASDPGRYLR